MAQQTLPMALQTQVQGAKTIRLRGLSEDVLLSFGRAERSPEGDWGRKPPDEVRGDASVPHACDTHITQPIYTDII